MFELDLSKIDAHIKSLIQQAVDVKTGQSVMEHCLTADFNEQYTDRFKELNLEASYLQFKTWFQRLAHDEPFGEDIVALYFGLIESRSGTQLFVTGSRQWSSSDSEWCQRSDYWPRDRYPALPIFQDITAIFKQDNINAWMYLTIGAPVLFIATLARECSQVFVTACVTDENKRKCFYLATGFDDGDLYTVANVTPEGVKVPAQ